MLDKLAFECAKDKWGRLPAAAKSAVVQVVKFIADQRHRLSGAQALAALDACVRVVVSSTTAGWLALARARSRLLQGLCFNGPTSFSLKLCGWCAQTKSSALHLGSTSGGYMTFCGKLSQARVPSASRRAEPRSCISYRLSRSFGMFRLQRRPTRSRSAQDAAQPQTFPRPLTLPIPIPSLHGSTVQHTICSRCRNLPGADRGAISAHGRRGFTAPPDARQNLSS